MRFSTAYLNSSVLIRWSYFTFTFSPPSLRFHECYKERNGQEGGQEESLEGCLEVEVRDEVHGVEEVHGLEEVHGFRKCLA